MPAKCFECGEVGHIAADCPAKLYAVDLKDRKPLWCGQCDRVTRLVYFVRDGYDAARKCRNCNPRSSQLPATYVKCGGCGRAIYAWDSRSECGQHQVIGRHLNCKREECECHGKTAAA